MNRAENEGGRGRFVRRIFIHFGELADEAGRLSDGWAIFFTEDFAVAISLQIAVSRRRHRTIAWRGVFTDGPPRDSWPGEPRSAL